MEAPTSHRLKSSRRVTRSAPLPVDKRDWGEGWEAGVRLLLLDRKGATKPQLGVVSLPPVGTLALATPVIRPDPPQWPQSGTTRHRVAGHPVYSRVSLHLPLSVPPGSPCSLSPGHFWVLQKKIEKYVFPSSMALPCLPNPLKLSNPVQTVTISINKSHHGKNAWVSIDLAIIGHLTFTVRRSRPSEHQ